MCMCMSRRDKGIELNEAEQALLHVINTKPILRRVVMEILVSLLVPSALGHRSPLEIHNEPIRSHHTFQFSGAHDDRLIPIRRRI